jgi:hypothetical protein
MIGFDAVDVRNPHGRTTTSKKVGVVEKQEKVITIIY